MILTIVNSKGGVAKSTTAAALAQAAAYRGRRALAVDLEPQGDLSFCLKADTSRPGVYEMMNGEAVTIQSTETGPDVIAASPNITTLTSSRGSARRLLAALEPIKGRYDLIVIDTVPATGELQYNALMASDGLVIPVTHERGALGGLYMMIETARRINPSSIAHGGAFIARYSPRSNVARHMVQTIQETCEALQVPYMGFVREGKDVQEAYTIQENLFDYLPRSKPAADYLALYDRLMEGRPDE